MAWLGLGLTVSFAVGLLRVSLSLCCLSVWPTKRLRDGLQIFVLNHYTCGRRFQNGSTAAPDVPQPDPEK